MWYTYPYSSGLIQWEWSTSERYEIHFTSDRNTQWGQNRVYGSWNLFCTNWKLIRRDDMEYHAAICVLEICGHFLPSDEKPVSNTIVEIVTGVSVAAQNLMVKISFVLASIPTKWSLRKFTHDTTISCLVMRKFCSDLTAIDGFPATDISVEFELQWN